MEISRKPFQGVLNILSFNRHFYVAGLTVLTVLTACYILFGWPSALYWVIVAVFLYGLVTPLVGSAYVYDFSGYYHFRWLADCELSDASTNLLLNINAGFDETSFIIKNHFPKSDLRVFDFYDATRHTEPAIVRARRVSLVYPNTQPINSDSIPLKDKTVDVIFLLSSAHEIRSHHERVGFLKECHRLCKPDGKLIVVEHLRDLPNFLAFSIGVTHFFSRAAWKEAFRQAGFRVCQETKFTPFMSIFRVAL